MLKEHYRMLKKINKTGYFIFSNITEKEKSILYYLRAQKYIFPKATPATTEVTRCYQITESGKTAIYTAKKEKITSVLPITISIVSLIATVAHLILSILGLV